MIPSFSSFIRGEDSVSADLPWGTDRYLDPQDWAGLPGLQTPRLEPQVVEAEAAVGGARRYSWASDWAKEAEMGCPSIPSLKKTPWRINFTAGAGGAGDRISAREKRTPPPHQ